MSKKTLAEIQNAAFYKWAAQGRTKEQKWAVRNFLTGAGDTSEAIKELFMEVIGGDEPELPEVDNPSIPYTARRNAAIGRNKLRAELRKAVEAL